MPHSVVNKLPKRIICRFEEKKAVVIAGECTGHIGGSAEDLRTKMEAMVSESKIRKLKGF